MAARLIAPIAIASCGFLGTAHEAAHEYQIVHVAQKTGSPCQPLGNERVVGDGSGGSCTYEGTCSSGDGHEVTRQCGVLRKERSAG